MGEVYHSDATVPQERVIVASSLLNTVPHLLPAEDAVSERNDKPVRVEVHHAAAPACIVDSREWYLAASPVLQNRRAFAKGALVHEMSCR